MRSIVLSQRKERDGLLEKSSSHATIRWRRVTRCQARCDTVSGTL